MSGTERILAKGSLGRERYETGVGGIRVLRCTHKMITLGRTWCKFMQTRRSSTKRNCPRELLEMLCHVRVDPHSLLSHTRLSDTLSLQSYLLAPMLH